MNQQKQTRDWASDGFAVGTSEFAGSQPASDGWHDAVIAEVVDMGMDFKFRKEGDHRGALMIQLDEVVEDGDFEGQRKEVRFHFSVDLGLGSATKKGSKLRTRLEEWRARPFTQQELEDITNGVKPLRLGDLVGKPLRVMTATEMAKTSDREYAKIVKFAPANADVSKRLSVSDDYVPYHSRESSKKAGDAHQRARGNNAADPWDEERAAAAGGGGASAGTNGAPADDPGPGF